MATRSPPLRPLAAALALAALAGCSLSPSGACEADRDCEPGRHCAEGVCVPDGRSDLYAGCVVDRDCDPHALCTRGVCVLAPGRCAGTLDCAAWESCEANVCLPLPGRCGTLLDCQPWELCIAAAQASPPLPEHRCAVAPGRCTSAADCGSWQLCTPTRFCETAPGFCAGDADCDAWKACGTDHLCALRAGACEVQDDCPSDRICQANACLAQPAPPALDPAAVHLVGTLEPGTPGRAAIAPVGAAPGAKLLGLAAGDVACGARVAPDGRVLLARGAAALATLVPDAIEWDAAADAWTYPADPAANDEAVTLPAGCAGATAVSAVLQPGTGALLVGCDGAWFDAAGAPVGGGRPLLAWSAGGRMLSGSRDMVDAPVLLDAAGLEIPLSGEGMPVGDRLVAWRGDGDGFRVVRALGAAGLADLEVWAIDGAGAAVRATPLPPLPASVTEVDPPVLDAAGDVFQLGRAAGGDVVVRRTAGAAEAVIVHDEAALPPAGAAATLLDARVHAADAPCLLTGP